jgi:adenosylmethionine-8-amino-7-oxononanoate aminotransferase
MEPATISALAALAGATIGGVTSFAATWLTQRTQARVQELTHSLTVREQLYKAFIKEASKLYADALVHEISDISHLVGLYAMISEMRVISARNTVENADKVARMILNTYRAPNKTLPELEDMVNRGAIDLLQTFSEAARQEFHRLGG